jgi:hypothetical protein
VDAIRVPTGDIDDALKDEMFRLFAPYYANISSRLFIQDLRDKDFVILLRHGGALAGFTTVRLFNFAFEGRERLIVFSGDTIVAREHWGKQALAHAWIAELGRIGGAHPGTPFYWFLIVKGHRTFRYMPTFVHNFVPRWAVQDDVDLVRLRDAVATDMFAGAFDARTGLIRFPERRGNLAPEWAQPNARERVRADVAFFLQRNPGFAEGDELACLCEISEANMRPLTRRLYLRGVNA